jgi:spermidine/putrescine transport system ATP-binding protein
MPSALPRATAAEAEPAPAAAVAPPVPEPGPAVELSGVTKAYGDQLAVRDVSLAVRRGEFFALLGPSGCGKTTTLRAIAGFVAPDAGHVRIDGRDVAGVPPYRRNVNTVFQSYALFPHLSVFENVAFSLREQRRPKDEVRTRVERALELVRLGGHGPRRPRQLSGGQQQRVALARALVNRPAVLLLDEPMGALDLKLRREMQLELKHIQRETGISFVHVTHDQEEALTMADRVGIMAEGRLEQVGSPADVYERPLTRFVADFVGTSSFLAGEQLERDGELACFRLVTGEVVRVASAVAGLHGACVLSLRPEAVHLHASEPRYGNAVRARVREVVYVGPAIGYQLQVGEARLLASQQNTPGSAERRFTAGDEVWASWDPSGGRLVAA